MIVLNKKHIFKPHQLGTLLFLQVFEAALDAEHLFWICKFLALECQIYFISEKWWSHHAKRCQQHGVERFGGILLWFWFVLWQSHVGYISELIYSIFVIKQLCGWFFNTLFIFWLVVLKIYYISKHNLLLNRIQYYKNIKEILQTTSPWFPGSLQLWQKEGLQRAEAPWRWEGEGWTVEVFIEEIPW